MSSRTRDYVGPNAEMFRAVGYDAEGTAVWSVGPYSTRGPAMRARHGWRGRAVRVRVEVCRPTWEAVPGTEITR